MKIFKISIIIFILTAYLCTFVSAEGFIQNFSDNTLKHFSVSGEYVSCENGNLTFAFPKREAASLGSYIYRKNLLIDTFFLEMSISFSDSEDAKGAILLRNYQKGTGFYNLVSFSEGIMSFATGGSMTVPENKFRIKIIKEGNEINFYVNGSLESSGSPLQSFYFSNEVEVRIEFYNSCAEAGEAHNVYIDNLLMLVNENCDSIFSNPAEFYIDFGRERIRTEKVLDPFESITTSVMMANPTEENKKVMLFDGRGFKGATKTLAPGEITEITLTNTEGNVNSGDSQNIFLWNGEKLLQPFKEKQTIKNDTIVIPKIADIKKMISNLSCGGIWVSGERIVKMREYLDKNSKNYDETFSGYWQKLLYKGDALINENCSTPVGVQGASRTLERVALLSTLYKVSLESKYAERALKEMLFAAEYPAWGDEVNFLPIAAELLGLAIGYDALYDYINDNDKITILNAIYQKGISVGLRVYREGNDTWDTRTTNWNMICNSAMAAAALVTGADGKFSDDCAEILNTALRNLRLTLNRFTKKGLWDEGVGYWGYMLTYGIDLFVMLENAFGTCFGYENHYALWETGNFIIGSYGAFRYNYDDCEDSETGFNTSRLFYFSHITGDNSFAKYQIESLKVQTPTIRDALLYKSEYKEGTLSALNTDFYDSEAKVAAFRDNFKDNTYLAFNAGNNFSSHAQLDMGSFVYDWGGTRWFSDLGIDNYDLYKYLDYYVYKYFYYRNRAEGHNTMVLSPGTYNEDNPQSAPDQNIYAEGEITKIQTGDRFSYAVADLHSAYPGSCTAYKRGYLLDKETKAMVICDDITTDKEIKSFWFAHTKASVKLSEDKKSAILTRYVSGEEKKLYVEIISGGDSFEVMDALPLETSPNPDILQGNIDTGLTQNKNKEYKKLAICQNLQAGNNKIIIIAIPYENRDQIDKTLEKCLEFKGGIL